MKIGLITLNGNDNYGNKLQHYAIQKYFEKKGISVETIAFYNYKKIGYYLKHLYKYITRKRYRNFCRFDRNINYYKEKVFYKRNINIPSNIEKYFDYFLVGSDQVWNSSILSFKSFYLLDFIKNNNKKISVSASFGISNIPKKDIKLFKSELMKFKAISVREDRGKEMISELTGRNDIETLIDPTMILDEATWCKIMKKPKGLSNRKYILNYFLGNLSNDKMFEIKKIAEKNNYVIINILDKNSPFYNCGPSEFLYLEKNASLICTDSFHSSVFAILFNVPFIVFKREQDGIESINSRLDTLIQRFKLKDREYTNHEILNENLKCDYKEAYKLLDKAKNDFDNFFDRAFQIKECDRNER